MFGLGPGKDVIGLTGNANQGDPLHSLLDASYDVMAVESAGSGT